MNSPYLIEIAVRIHSEATLTAQTAPADVRVCVKVDAVSEVAAVQKFVEALQKLVTPVLYVTPT